jgi:phage replication-related protein YjqB (UPF0714/DUF867 family)
MRFLGFLLSLCSVGLFADTYSSYAELSRAEREGVDYRIKAEQRPSPFLVLAIHGGAIEPGASEIAEAVAGEDLSLYLFEGLKERDNRRLHITSTRFDEPRALALVAKADYCLSLHGFAGKKPEICLGGAQSRLVKDFSEALRKRPEWEILLNCTGFEGRVATNIVNRCLRAGVQVELSSELRKLLKEKPELAAELSADLRSALRLLHRKTN